METKIKFLIFNFFASEKTISYILLFSDYQYDVRPGKSWSVQCCEASMKPSRSSSSRSWFSEYTMSRTTSFRRMNLSRGNVWRYWYFIILDSGLWNVWSTDDSDEISMMSSSISKLFRFMKIWFQILQVEWDHDLDMLNSVLILQDCNRKDKQKIVVSDVVRKKWNRYRNNDDDVISRRLKFDNISYQSNVGRSRSNYQLKKNLWRDDLSKNHSGNEVDQNRNPHKFVYMSKIVLSMKFGRSDRMLSRKWISEWNEISITCPYARVLLVLQLEWKEGQVTQSFERSRRISEDDGRKKRNDCREVIAMNTSLCTSASWTRIVVNIEEKWHVLDK